MNPPISVTISQIYRILYEASLIFPVILRFITNKLVLILRSHLTSIPKIQSYLNIFKSSPSMLHVPVIVFCVI